MDYSSIRCESSNINWPTLLQYCDKFYFVIHDFIENSQNYFSPGTLRVFLEGPFLSECNPQRNSIRKMSPTVATLQSGLFRNTITLFWISSASSNFIQKKRKMSRVICICQYKECLLSLAHYRGLILCWIG